VAQAADAVGSTSQIIRWVEEAPSGSAFAIGTEHRLVLRLASDHRDKTIVGLADVPSFCASMGRIRLEDLRSVLDRLTRGEPTEHVEVPPALASAARAGVERMLGLSPATPTDSVR
jgi:quinolinate synthase